MNDVIDTFIEVLHLAGKDVDRDAFSIDDLGCPHTPKGLPSGKMAIYAFRKDGQYLKIGKAGPSSDARFRSQHYSSCRAKSNLAKSLLDDPEMASNNLDENTIGEWIKRNVHRVDILIDQDVGIFVLNFLESFLHCKFNPKYEDFENQR